MEAESREEVMSAEELKTSYPAVEHLESFWVAVFHFIALKEAEGKQVAAGLMTECVAIRLAVSNVGHEDEGIPRTSALQEQACQSLWAFLDDPALTPEGKD